MGTIGGFRTVKVICLIFLTGSLWLLCWEQTHTVIAVWPGGDDWNNPGKRQWRQETVKSHWILDIFCYKTNNFLTDWIHEKGSRMISKLWASWLWTPYVGVMVMVAVGAAGILPHPQPCLEEIPLSGLYSSCRHPHWVPGAILCAPSHLPCHNACLAHDTMASSQCIYDELPFIEAYDHLCLKET